MDYLYVIILYILTPYVFDSTNIKYNQNVGFFINDEVDTTIWNVKPIKTNTDYDLIVSGKPTYGGYYGWLYEVYSEYTVYTSEKTWFSARFSWSPLRQGVNFVVKSPDVVSAKPTQIIYNEDPAFGVMVGYDWVKYNKLRSIPASFSPYFGASVLRISYATIDIFQTKNNFDTTLKYHLGFNMQLDNSWSFLTEFSFYRLSVRDLDGLAQNVTITPFKLKVGLAYNFKDTELIRKSNKDEAYTNIIKSIDVQLDDKIQEKEDLKNKKKLQEEEKAIEKQKEQESKTKENEDKQDKQDNSRSSTIKTNASPTSNIEVEEEDDNASGF